jgi:hypothetical protein
MDLHAWRHRADPIADDAVAALRERGERGDPLDGVRALARSGDEACARFVDATRVLPSWHDPHALRAGRRMATRQAPLTFMVLLAGSLVESFAVADGAAVLVKTGRLERDSTRRIYETATLVRALLFDGAEAPGAAGHEALLRVRLLHAFVRRWVTSSGFDTKTRGVPVNQMDMLHTLLVFSHVVTRGLATMGVQVSDEEKASWCALWRLAGQVLGVDDALLFKHVRDELDRYADVNEHYAPDDGSRALAHAVLGALAGEPPFFLPKGALDQIARTLLGDALGDAFFLENSAAWQRTLAVTTRGVHGIDAFARRVPGGTRAGYVMGRAFIEANRWRVLRNMKPADYRFRTA